MNALRNILERLRRVESSIMSNIKAKYFAYILILFLIFVINVVSATEVEKKAFLPGTIPVIFYDNVTEGDVDVLMKLYGLTWESWFSKEFSYWVRVLDGLPEDYVGKLKEYPIVLWAEIRENSELELGFKFILVRFKVNESENEAKELISKFKSLKIESINAHKVGIIKVNLGEERKWVDILKKEGIVKSIDPTFLNDLDLRNAKNPRVISKLSTDPKLYFYFIGIIVLVILALILLYSKLRNK